MKKNVMMRLASFLLVAVLISTSAISGTYAKYVTTASGTDTARVAKWGVTASVTGDAFATSYAIEDDVDDEEITLAVESSIEDKLVAPGTSGTFTGVALTGTPEVAVNVTHTATVTLTGWEILPSTDEDDDANDPADGTAADPEGQADDSANEGGGEGEGGATGTYYCPIVITVNGTAISGLDYSSAAEFAAAVKGAIETANGDYAPNTDLSGVAGMNGDYTWTWAFDGDDTNDTALGDQAAAGNAATITITVSTTVTQID